MAFRGQWERDRDRFLNGGSTLDLHDNAEEVDPDLEGMVCDLAVAGPISDPRNVRVVAWDCPDRPDARTQGAVARIEHTQQCQHCRDRWRGELSALPAKFHRDPDHWWGVKLGGLRRVPAPADRSMVGSAAVDAFVGENRLRPIPCPGGEVTIVGGTIDAFPDETTAPVVPVVVFVGQRLPSALRGVVELPTECGVVEVRGIGRSATRFPRGAVKEWMDSSVVDDVNNRDMIGHDAKRFGCAIVYGVRGRLPAPTTDVADELRELRARIAQLEGRPSKAVTDPHSFDFTPESRDR